LEAVGRLAAGVAHEINTPVQFIGDNLAFLAEAFKTFDQLLEKYRAGVSGDDLPPALVDWHEALVKESAGLDLDFLRDEIPAAIAQSRDGVSRVSSIVGAMKSFAHPDGATQEIADLNEALASTIAVARSEISKAAEVVTDFGDIPSVRCFRGDLNQVFLNLLVNAGHAVAAADRGIGAGATVTIRTWQDGSDVLISISDTGTGIPEDVQSKIFDHFFTTKGVGQGTGQGLPLAKALVDRHLGALTFDTEVGVGTTFTVRLPIDGASQPTD
jgi:signal transduction histidine kinase